MNELSLFTGAGGGILGGKLLGWKTVCYVEWDKYCQQIIKQRIKDGIYDDAPIWDDIRTFDGRPWAGCVDIVTAGFPCQPFSVAGRRKGEDDERNMWPDTLRVISEVRPRYAFLENVPGLLTSGYFGTILRGLAESGYDAEWCVLGADDVGAPHRRKRLWILAHAAERQPRQSPESEGRKDTIGGSQEGRITWWDTDPADVAHADTARPQGYGRPEQCTREQPVAPCCAEPRITWWDTDPADVGDTEYDGWVAAKVKQGARTGDDSSKARPEQDGKSTRPSELPDTEGRRQDGRCGDVWRDGSLRTDTSLEHTGRGEEGDGPRQGRPAKPRLGRVAHGVANRVNRLKAIGNGQVPAVAAAAWELLIKNVVE